jgi:hypothetical protein
MMAMLRAKGWKLSAAGTGSRTGARDERGSPIGRQRFHNMKICMRFLLVGWLWTGTFPASAATLHISPADSLATLAERLANDAGIREVIFEEGVYRGNLHVRGPKGTDFSANPLLIRAADGARVVFDGSRSLDKFESHPALPGVFQMEYTHRGGEYPKLWEPNTRTRYLPLLPAQPKIALSTNGENQWTL